MNVGESLKELYSLKDKVILFTGAAGGIGTVLSKGLSSVGAKLALCDFNIDALNKIEKEIQESGGEAKSFSLNLEELNSIERCVANVIHEFGNIDVLINCAGINARKGLLDFTEEEYDKILNVNLKGAFFMSQFVGKEMIKNKKGSIINFASTNGRVSILGGCAPYGATKNGLISLTRSLTVELSKHGIRTNAIAPGTIKTPLSEGYWADTEQSGFLLDRIAMNRPAIPEELLGLTILLCSDASSYMNGSVYVVDGGYEAGGQTWHFETEY